MEEPLTVKVWLDAPSDALALVGLRSQVTRVAQAEEATKAKLPQMRKSEVLSRRLDLIAFIVLGSVVAWLLDDFHNAHIRVTASIRILLPRLNLSSGPLFRAFPCLESI